jgi:hypothetical protein
MTGRVKPGLPLRPLAPWPIPGGLSAEQQACDPWEVIAIDLPYDVAIGVQKAMERHND